MIARDIASQFARSPETLHLSRRGPSQLERLFAGLLADPGDAPKGDEVDGSPDIERKKQDRVKKQHDKSRAESEKGTPVRSPGSDKSATGPLGPGRSPHDGVQPEDEDDDDDDETSLGRRRRAFTDAAGPVDGQKDAPKPRRRKTDGQAEDESSEAQDRVQEDYQDVQDEEDDPKPNKVRGKPGTTPGSDPGATGAQGDSSAVVGYQAGRRDARKFVAAFGRQGGIWFAEGKTFVQAMALHAKSARGLAALTAGNERRLAAAAVPQKPKMHRAGFGYVPRQRAGGSPGIDRFARGLRIPR